MSENLEIPMMTKGLVLFLYLMAAGIGQQPRALTSADYARAEKFMGYNTAPLVLHSGVRPVGLAYDGLWYRSVTAGGSEFVQIDAASGGTRSPLFDHARLAIAISAATGTNYDAAHLPFTDAELSTDGNTLTFNVRARRLKCDLAAGKCVSEAGQAPAARGPAARLDVPSPDKKRTAFLPDYNLWVRDLSSAKEPQPTKDCVEEFA